MTEHTHRPGPDGAQPHLQPGLHDDCSCLLAHADLDGTASDIYGKPDRVVDQAQDFENAVDRHDQAARYSVPRGDESVNFTVDALQPGMQQFLTWTVGLSYQQAQVFVMAEGYGATPAQIGRALGITKATVSELLTRARQQCREWRKDRAWKQAVRQINEMADDFAAVLAPFVGALR